MIVERRELNLIENGLDVLRSLEADKACRSRNLRIAIFIVRSAQPIAEPERPLVPQQLICGDSQSAFAKIEFLSSLSGGVGRRWVRTDRNLEIHRTHVAPDFRRQDFAGHGQKRAASDLLFD